VTAQFSDTVKYRGKDYALAGKNGIGLFDIRDQGLHPHAGCTACWRGFVCEYEVEGRRLLLDSVSTWLEEPAPKLFGIPARKRQDDREIFGTVYRRLRQPIPYTGGLLLGDDFIEELYVHMGFHPAWKYREVHELEFEDGELVREADRSAEIAEFRRDLSERVLEPGLEDSEEDVKRWIERCFSQEYRW
jgi:hypothetical protein